MKRKNVKWLKRGVDTLITPDGAEFVWNGEVALPFYRLTPETRAAIKQRKAEAKALLMQNMALFAQPRLAEMTAGYDDALAKHGTARSDKIPSAGPNYPCADCGCPRTKAEGGTTWTICDACYNRREAAVVNPPTEPARVPCRVCHDCDSPASHVIVGIPGQMRYYCDAHLPGTTPPAETAPYEYMPGEIVNVQQRDGSRIRARFLRDCGGASQERLVLPDGGPNPVRVWHDACRSLTPQPGDLVVNIETGEGGVVTGERTITIATPPNHLEALGSTLGDFEITPDWRVVWRKEGGMNTTTETITLEDLEVDVTWEADDDGNVEVGCVRAGNVDITSLVDREWLEGQIEQRLADGVEGGMQR